jgi:hypothetical protein
MIKVETDRLDNGDQLFAQFQAPVVPRENEHLDIPASKISGYVRSVGYVYEADVLVAYVRVRMKSVE